MGPIKPRGRLAAAGIALASLCVPPAGADDTPVPTVMQPSSPWIVDYADDSCALRRTFEANGEKAWLELRQYAPGYEFVVTVASNSFNMTKHAPRVSFLPDGPVRQDKLTAYGIYGAGVQGVAFPDTLRPDLRGQDFLHWGQDEEFAREKSVTGLSVEYVFSPNLVLQTGELHKPMDAMRTCLDDLLKSWGIDPDVNLHLSQEAHPIDQSKWQMAIQTLYPTSLFRISGYSRVTFRLLIDETGTITGCKVQRPVVDDGYEKQICAIFLKQAKYTPALDASGKPVKSIFLMSVVYHAS